MGDAGAAIALGARVVLAATLTVAAFSKLAARERLAGMVAPLVPRAAVRPVAALLPAAELAVAAALLAVRGAVPGVVAAVLVVAFTAVLVRAQIRQVPCPCFGAGADRYVPGAIAVVRNGVLVALAVLATGSVGGARPGGVALAILGLGAPAVLTAAAAR